MNSFTVVIILLTIDRIESITDFEVFKGTPPAEYIIDKGKNFHSNLECWRKVCKPNRPYCIVVRNTKSGSCKLVLLAARIIRWNLETLLTQTDKFETLMETTNLIYGSHIPKPLVLWPFDNVTRMKNFGRRGALMLSLIHI